MSVSAQKIRATLLRLAAERADRTFCPSEAARALDPEDWRTLMPAIREVAHALAAQGRLRGTQRGKTIDPQTARGPIRLQAP